MAAETVQASCGLKELRTRSGRAERQQTSGCTLGQMVREAEDGAGNVHTIRSQENLTGVATWRILPWDTALLGMLTARIDDISAPGPYPHVVQQYLTLLTEVTEACRAKGVRYLTVRVDIADTAAIHGLEDSGFNLVDSIQTFSLDLQAPGAGKRENGHLPVRAFEKSDLDDVLMIARTSYICDRFHLDPVIGKEKADALHEAWLRNSCAGIGCDQVIVGVDRLGVTGYATCKLDKQQMGTIVMVATAARVRGQGWGLATSTEALEWFRANDVHVVEVGTQLRNTAAASLYRKAGFRPAGATFTFRKLLS